MSFVPKFCEYFAALVMGATLVSLLFTFLFLDKVWRQRSLMGLGVIFASFLLWRYTKP